MATYTPPPAADAAMANAATVNAVAATAVIAKMAAAMNVAMGAKTVAATKTANHYLMNPGFP